MVAKTGSGVALAAAGLALAAIASKPAQAQDAARIEAIERQIQALQSELNRMRREMAGREAETRAARKEAERARAEAKAAQQRLDTTPPPPAVSPPPTVAQAITTPPPADQVRLGFPNNRPTMTSADGRFEAFLGGQFQYDVGGYLRGPAPNPNTRGVPHIQSFGENLRRGRLFFGFRYDDFQLNVTPDFGGSPDGTPTLYEANFNWMPVKPLTVTLGYFKPWITLQDSMSSNDFLFLERPAIIDIARGIAAGDSRSSVGARWAEDRWVASGYLTGDTFGANNTTQATRGQTGGVFRVAGRPYTDANTDVHLGLSGSYAFNIRSTASGQTLQLRERPELRIDQSRLIDTGALPADKAWTWGPEFGLRWRNFLLQGEYVQIGVDQAQAGSALRPSLTFQGGYAEASWVITGEERRYSAASGAFGRPNPRYPFDFHGGGWGAWELMARYSVADLNDRVTRGRPQSATGGVFGGKQTVIGLGVSWYPTNYLRFMLDWDIVNVDRLNAAGTTQIGQRFNTVALRTQVAF
jgi:phosphate-selective porin OprO and OprP